MRECYKESNFNAIGINRTEEVKGVNNPQIYTECEKQRKKIVDYLNGFKLTKVSSKKAFKNINTNKLGNCVTFFKLNKKTGKDPQTDEYLKIHFLSPSTWEIFLSCNEINKEGIEKYYKIENGKVDINHICKLLNGAKKEKY